MSIKGMGTFKNHQRREIMTKFMSESTIFTGKYFNCEGQMDESCQTAFR